MYHIAIISGSVREGRKSHRVSLFFQKYLLENHLATVELLDLKEYQFPLFHERLSLQSDPSEQARAFAAAIINADGVILVTPEYNGGYPASVKNVTDLLYKEWHHKPIAITTASNGSFGGSQCITSLQFTLWKIRAWTVPAMFPNPNVQDAYDDAGNPTNKAETEKRAKLFLDELFWCIQAADFMKAKG